MTIYAEESQENTIGEMPCDIDGNELALITVHYGGYNELRRRATMSAVMDWDRQNRHPDEAVFLELVCPGERPCFQSSDLPSWLRYIRIYGKERNRNLFQKEALWNLATKFTIAPKLLYLDSDVSPIDMHDYFMRISDAIAPGTIVHACFKLIQEGYEEDYLGEMYSVLAPFDKTPGNRYRFPGIGYGMTRQDYHDRDGFNPFSIPGSGDVIFIWETFPDIHQPMGSARRFHEALIRPNRPALRHVAPDGIVMQHNYHGAKVDRAYVWSREAVLLFGIPNAYCHIDQSGLLAWNDPDFILKDILMQKSRMHTKDDLYELVCETVKKRLDRQEYNQKRGKGHYDRRDFNQYD